MEQKKQKFEITATNAEETLRKTEEKIDAAMGDIDGEKFGEMREKLVDEKAEELIDVVERAIIDLQMKTMETRVSSLQRALSSALLSFPPGLADSLIKKMVQHTNWNNLKKNTAFEDGLTLSLIISTLGVYFEKMARNNEDTTDTSENELTFTFSESDFDNKIDDFGAYLPSSVKVYFLGNVGSWIGRQMNGGKLIISGNARAHAGLEMSGGILDIQGDAGYFAGNGMKGGTLSIDGKVDSFSSSAFELSNKGTIVWKGVTIWNKGKWTDAGILMRQQGTIPGIQ